MEIRNFLKETVLEANKLITPEVIVKAKGDKGDLVTNFDYEIEKFIINKLQKEYPKFDIISEEFNSKNKVTSNCFTIDPIDGTVNFAHNIPIWCIQIGCIKDGNICASIIYIPKLNEMYEADETGAYLNGERIKVNNLTPKNSIYTLDGGKESRTVAIERMMENANHCRIIGSAGVSFAFVASGRLGGEVFRNDTPWDYVPGLFLVKQAGGYITNEDGKHIGANTEEFLNILKEKAICFPEDK